jgi:hypothetical protein
MLALRFTTGFEPHRHPLMVVMVAWHAAMTVLRRVVPPTLLVDVRKL